MQYDVSLFTIPFLCIAVIPHIISVTPNQSLSHEENTSLSCVAIGYPLILITWTDPNGNTVQPLLETTEGNVVNSTIKVEAGSYAEGGGRYECRASNEIGVATTSSFVSGMREMYCLSVCFCCENGRED